MILSLLGMGQSLRQAEISKPAVLLLQSSLEGALALIFSVDQQVQHIFFQLI